MALHLEIRIEDEFELFMRSAAYAAPGGMTREELLKRWIATGLARDFSKPLEQAAAVVEKFVKVERK